MAVLLEHLAKHGSVPLEGYGHQVGGQYLLMKFGDSICKPLVLRENQFYKSLTDELRAFTATYYGVITVCFERQSSGEIKVIAYPHQERATAGALSISNLKASSGHGLTTAMNGVPIDGGKSYVSPWSAECTKNSAMKLQALGDQLDTVQQDYIVLENLSSRFTTPSILDLKMGSGDHNDYNSEVKRLKHLHTLENSTSKTLRVRMAGMQKYDAAKNEYMFRDKYYGRSLTEDGFREELRSFLHNGLMFRSDLLQNIVTMLEELAQVIERQDSYRFFSSSLLIIYDGAESPGNEDSQRGKQETRTNGTHTPTCPTHLPDDLKHSNGTVPYGKSPKGIDSCGSHGNNVTSESPDKLQSSKLTELRKKVDVRMIDFAHGVHSSFREDVKSPGCDEDYLIGLRTLIANFKSLLP